jgi:predicted AAA+ superfamily ATPase
MNDTTTKSIYVLYGIAGIGKSTVAKTAAERAAHNKVLGASFFFSRDEDNRKSAKSFFSTLAYHLSPALARRISMTVEEDPELTGRDPLKQFDRLIARPLQR